MIILEQIKTHWDLHSYLEIDSVYKDMLDGQQLEEYKPDLNHSVWFAVTDYSVLVGLVMIKQFSPNCMAIHGCTYLKYRGKGAHYLKQIMEILRKDHNWVYVSYTHKNNIPAQKALHKAGFVYKTTIPSGYLTGDLMLYCEK